MEFIRKFTSRKFLAAAAGVIAGLGMVFGLDEGIISTVSGAVTAVASVVAYIMAEGRIDASAVGNAAAKIVTAANTVAGEREETC